MHKVTLSMSQAQDLAAALNLRGVVYQLAGRPLIERK